MAEIGQKGGRSKRISAKQRRENARDAALARWRTVRDARSEEAGLRETGGRKRIWEVAREIVARIPPSELDKLPRDGSRYLDHYLYGAPKKSR